MVYDKKMTMNQPTPTHLEKKSDTEMKIVWSSGETTELPFVELRYFCPCAECVDEWTRERKIQRSQVKPDTHPRRVEAVGRYAIQIEWNDGHRTGIYPYSLLWAIAQHKISDQRRANHSESGG